MAADNTIQFRDSVTGARRGGRMPLPPRYTEAASEFSRDGTELQLLGAGQTLDQALRIRLDPRDFHDAACRLIPAGFDPNVLHLVPVAEWNLKPRCP